MTLFNYKRRYILSPEAIFGLNPLRKYELLFETLEPTLRTCSTPKTRGRLAISKQALLNDPKN